MNNGLNSYKSKLGVKWIKAKSGSTFLCPAGSVDNTSNMSDAELRDLCVQESLNPQND